MDELGNETAHPGYAAVVIGLAMLAIGAATNRCRGCRDLVVISQIETG
ncbi:MAG TPA: hypothetical protein H9987_05800 [Candidatus Luteococcus avicola]|nr:hypothetical protein [Candidatus Luteococcus avicola]